MQLFHILTVSEDLLTKVYLSKPAGERVEECDPNPNLVITAWSTPVATVKAYGEHRLATPLPFHHL